MFIKFGNEFAIANVYASCDSGGQLSLWNRLSVLINVDEGITWFV